MSDTPPDDESPLEDLPPDEVRAELYRMLREDLRNVSGQVGDLDNTIKTLFLKKADAARIFPNWKSLNDRLKTLEREQKNERTRVFKQIVGAVIIVVLIGAAFQWWYIGNQNDKDRAALHDRQIASCQGTNEFIEAHDDLVRDQQETLRNGIGVAKDPIAQAYLQGRADALNDNIVELRDCTLDGINKYNIEHATTTTTTEP